MADINKYKIMKPLFEGRTSSTVLINNLFIKFVIKYNEYDVYKREKYLASILKKFDWYPKLIYSYDEKKFLVFENCGISLNKENCPKNATDQINKILKDLKSVNVQHNDIKPQELLVDNNKKIYLCDFGWGSINNNFNCGINIWGGNNKLKPGGWHDDSTILTKLKNKYKIL